MTATKEELKAKARELFAYIDEKDGGYYPDRGTGRAWTVNVKMHGRYPQAVDLIAKMPRRYHKALLEHFDDETVQNIWDGWIENEAEYLMDMVKSGGSMQAMDAAAWQKYAGAALDAGKPTGYPAIDGLKTEAAKREKLNEFIRHDADMLDAFGAIDVQRGNKWTHYGVQRWINPGKGFASDIRAILKLDGLKPSDAERFAQALKDKTAIFASFELWRPYTQTDAGFYSRSGGHFCWRMQRENDIRDGLEAVIDWPEDLEADEAQSCVQEAQKLRERVEYITAWIEKAHKGLDFGAELQYRIDEKIDDIKTEEKHRRRERRDLALKAKSSVVAGVTVVQCLQHEKESVRRNAAGIIKEL